jgi:hypothetical protein
MVALILVFGALCVIGVVLWKLYALTCWVCRQVTHR